MENKAPLFRILAIDGGGVRGVIPARILQTLEEMAHKPISQLFDLIVGTSTGGLIALGLACPNQSKTPQYSAQDILNVYLEKSHQIFKKSFSRKILTIGGLCGAKYDRKYIDAILQDLFKETWLSEALLPVIIPTYSLNEGLPKINTSWNVFGNQKDCYMRDIAGATTAAPIYFDPKVFHDKANIRHINVDGGIFANNPEMIGATQARTLQPHISSDNMYILSIGSGTPKFNQTASQLTNAGVIAWVLKANLIDIMIDADDAWSNQEMSMLYPQSERLQIALPDNLGQMDNTSKANIQTLLNVTEHFIDTHLKTLENILSICQHPVT